MALKNIGSLWVSKPGQRSKLNGYLDGPNRTKGQRILVLPNDKATPENRQPQYRLVVQGDEGEAEPASFDSDDSVPF